MPVHFLHVTASGNRASIREHGLDWRLIGSQGFAAVSNNTVPDADGNFLARDEWEARWFINMGLPGQREIDVWEVTLDGDDWDRSGDPPAPYFEENGYLVWPAVIPPEQLQLLRTTSEQPEEFADPPILTEQFSGYFVGYAGETVTEEETDPDVFGNDIRFDLGGTVDGDGDGKAAP